MIVPFGSAADIIWQMPSLDDMELVRAYAARGSEEAFAALVSRHINLVYSVALRHLRHSHNAEEVTQAVFIILARKARSLRRETILSGWLFQTARLTAANFLRGEMRRARREEEACRQSTMHEEADPTWKQIAPLLNDAIASLGDKDRDAIVLRYLEGRNSKEIGTALGTSEEAAKKRVACAVEKLRLFFGRRGVSVPGAVLTGCIAAKSVEAAPAGLAAAVAAHALAGTALTASTSALVKGTLKIMAYTKAKMAVAAGIVALVAAQSYEIARQHNQLAALQEQAPTTNAKVEAQPAPADSQELEQLRADQANLRKEVTTLRGQLAAAKSTAIPPSQSKIPAAQEPPRENPGRELGLAVAQGDPTALDKLLALSKAEHQYFHSNSVGMNDDSRGGLAREAFAPLRAAFDAITEEAAKGNAAALQAVSRATQIPELQGFAVEAAGVLAGNGDEVALQILLNPKDYNILPSSAIGALKPAAENGNQKAIEALAAVAADPGQNAFWYMAADGLGNAAASGNPAAIEALIAMSGDTNSSIRGIVIAGLQRASANQNAKAADALRQMNGP